MLAQGALALTVCRERDWGRVRPAMCRRWCWACCTSARSLRFCDTLDWGTFGAWATWPASLFLLGGGAYGLPRCVREAGPRPQRGDGQLIACAVVKRSSGSTDALIRRSRGRLAP